MVAWICAPIDGGNVMSGLRICIFCNSRQTWPVPSSLFSSEPYNNNILTYPPVNPQEPEFPPPFRVSSTFRQTSVAANDALTAQVN